MNQTSRESGFSLAEVIVAFAILSLALVAIFKSFGLVARGTTSGEQEREALAIARSILASAGVTAPLQDGSVSGTSDNGLIWIRKASPYGPPVASGLPRPVLVDVALSDGKREGSLVRLSTIKLLPAQ